MIALDRDTLDLADADAIRRCCADIKPSLILNAGAATAIASDPFSWGAGTECEAAKGGGAAINGERTSAPRRLRPPACRERKGAHALGAIIEARSWNCDIDIAQCLHCGGQLKLIAAIEEPAAIARILTHLELAAQPPPRAPAVRVDLFEAA